MKIAVIGLGDIAQKAYLPVISQIANIEVHLVTRNKEKLKMISSKYRFPHIHHDLSSLMTAGVQAAFVHSSTESHYEMVKELLLHNIHVYVDKPITYHYETSKELVELAEARQLILMTGFNRRFSPFYQSMKEITDPNMVILQKNRHALPGDIRTFVYDDFIHCLDTVRYLFHSEIDHMLVTGKKDNGLLHHVVVQLISKEMTGIAIMNRDNGAVEERLEVMGPMEKRMVTDLAEMVIQSNNKETKVFFNNWDSTLYKRGFEQIVNEFILAITAGTAPSITARDALKTHELCEAVVNQLENL
ncbi:oxidoreductase [Bacillus sp. MRMR6]|nr:oxidoreductase [Bacillus sp. MRMR6]